MMKSIGQYGSLGGVIGILVWVCAAIILPLAGFGNWMVERSYSFSTIAMMTGVILGAMLGAWSHTRKPTDIRTRQ